MKKIFYSLLFALLASQTTQSTVTKITFKIEAKKTIDEEIKLDATKRYFAQVNERVEWAEEGDENINELPMTLSLENNQTLSQDDLNLLDEVITEIASHARRNDNNEIVYPDDDTIIESLVEFLKGKKLEKLIQLSWVADNLNSTVVMIALEKNQRLLKAIDNFLQKKARLEKNKKRPEALKNFIENTNMPPVGFIQSVKLKIEKAEESLYKNGILLEEQAHLKKILKKRIKRTYEYCDSARLSFEHQVLRKSYKIKWQSETDLSQWTTIVLDNVYCDDFRPNNGPYNWDKKYKVLKRICHIAYLKLLSEDNGQAFFDKCPENILKIALRLASKGRLKVTDEWDEQNGTEGNYDVVETPERALDYIISKIKEMEDNESGELKLNNLLNVGAIAWVFGARAHEGAPRRILDKCLPLIGIMFGKDIKTLDISDNYIGNYSSEMPQLRFEGLKKIILTDTHTQEGYGHAWRKAKKEQFIKDLKQHHPGIIIEDDTPDTTQIEQQQEAATNFINDLFAGQGN